MSGSRGKVLLKYNNTTIAEVKVDESNVYINYELKVNDVGTINKVMDYVGDVYIRWIKMSCRPNVDW